LISVIVGLLIVATETPPAGHGCSGFELCRRLC